MKSPRIARRMALAPALALICLAGASFAQVSPPASDPPPALVTVTGEATERYVPDEVSFSFNVTTEAEDLLAAKRENAETVAELLAYLESAGVPEENVQTRYLNVATRYRDPQRVQPRYVADQFIHVTLEEVDRFDEVNTGLLQRGVTSVNGPNFGYSRAEVARDSARLAAVRDARVKATALAAALGQRIGPAYRIDDAHERRGGQPMMMRAAAMDMGEAAGPGIAVGESELRHTVTVAFYLFPE